MRMGWTCFPEEIMTGGQRDCQNGNQEWEREGESDSIEGGEMN